MAAPLRPRPSLSLRPLTATVSPALARDLIKSGEIYAHDDLRITDELKDLAWLVCQHQKESNRYQSRLHHGRNTLLVFLCAVHGSEPPTEENTLQHIMAPDSPQLPLCYWESVYYALLSEIRHLHNDVRTHLSNPDRDGTMVLHLKGKNCDEHDVPFTMLDLSAQLEQVWSILLDPRLLGRMDVAVSTELRTTGMIDFTEMTPADISDMLWQKFAPIVRQACAEELRIELTLQPPRVEPPSPPPREEVHCICHASCRCQNVCQFQIHACACHCQEADRSPTESIESPKPRYARPHYRDRSNTTETLLADVPELLPFRGGRSEYKDPYPLGLYEDRQRYPPFPTGHNNQVAQGDTVASSSSRAEVQDSQAGIPPSSSRIELTKSLPARTEELEQTETDFQSWKYTASPITPEPARGLFSRSGTTLGIPASIRRSSPAGTSPTRAIGPPPPFPPPPPPLPDFIKPKPVRPEAQRWVTAGGDEPIHLRQVIGYGPDVPWSPGYTGRQEPHSVLTTPRPIRDEAVARGSAEDYGDKRERKGSSARSSRIKRLFSFSRGGVDT